MVRKLALGIAPAMLLFGTQAIAAAPVWKVSEVSGDVRLSEAGRTRPAAKGALLGSGAMITTAPGARAVIVRGQEFVVISPGTRIRVPEASNPNKIMQLIEDWGSALFKIEKKSTPHFGVQTPYLAAVVKGTTFTVTVGPEDAKVKVTEGAVEVSTLDGGASDLVLPGSFAMVGKSDLYRLTVDGKGSKEIRSGAAPAAGLVTTKVPNEASVAKGDNRSARAEAVRIAKTIGEKPASLAKLTGGLVEGASAAEHAQGQFNEHSRHARGPKPDKGDKPGKDDKPDKDKPGKDDKPDKDKPGDGGKDDDGGKPADGGKGDDGKPGGGADGGAGGKDDDKAPGKGSDTDDSEDDSDAGKGGKDDDDSDDGKSGKDDDDSDDGKSGKDDDSDDDDDGGEDKDD
jgi:hypothetical protein